MKAPSLLTRALVPSFVTVAIVLGAVFAVLSLRVRDQVRQAVSDNLASPQQVFTRVEARRQRDMRASVATLAETPTLKAALHGGEQLLRARYMDNRAGVGQRHTAGHSETLRLGALLHDIGKIGVPDEILRKAGALTAAEFESIKAHPSAGASILRSIPFLSPHIPIVELHHERPDGLGYPYGLRGDDIPLAARIVHVADAFDAMTSARAYRSGRLPVEAVAELRRCIGSDFDGPAVEALVAALPRLVSAVDPVSGSRMEEHWGRSGGSARGRGSREVDGASNIVETLR